jgi:hypothetical protein
VAAVEIVIHLRADLRSHDRTRLGDVKKGLLITDVKTSLFLLSKVIWIKGDDDMGCSPSVSLKGIVTVNLNVWKCVGKLCTQYLPDFFRVNLR